MIAIAFQPSLPLNTRDVKNRRAYCTINKKYPLKSFGYKNKNSTALVVFVITPHFIVPLRLDRYQFSLSYRTLPSLQISNVDLESHRLHTGDT
ncbi:hypothetical protein, partial [Enterobacter cloacae]|uniref:hypothetical protein n=1 Tax=Enterobacter cloacae TaxID=550 RepID=UPI001E3810DA